jgi:succinyl-diaminopimelate desuccinylase
VATDLLAATARLVDIPSPSHHEETLADAIEEQVGQATWLHTRRVGHNVVARTEVGRDRRVILAGHLDTVPANGNERAVVDGAVLHGLGAADMKGGLAVMLEVARSARDPLFDITFVFYVCEEVDRRHSGLLQLEAEAPELLAGDVAILGEPTSCRVEAGCQGNLRAAVRLGGRRAHTARPWMGLNAIHRCAPVLEAVAAWPGREPVIDGCRYREALQVVAIEGGVANNVVPDEVVLTLNHRFAPDRDAHGAWSWVESVVTPLLEPENGDALDLIATATAAPPDLTDPVLAGLVARTGEAPRAKLGWTDVAFFAERGIPATNFGPGDPTLAHTREERVDGHDLERARAVLSGVLLGT